MKKTTLTIVTIAISLTITSAFAGKMWETDFEKASANAKASNRYMLLNFSGSDWCGWCIKLDDEVFSKKDFKNYAKENLVCVLVDSPRSGLRKKLEKQNNALKTKYNITGFPSVLILDPSGEEIFKTGYKKGGPEKYIEQLDVIISMHRTKNKISIPTSIPTAIQTKNINSIHLTSPTIRRPTRPKKLIADNTRENRTWKARNGATIEASIIEEKGTTVILKKEDGSIVKIPKRNLSTADQAHIKELINTEN